MKVRKMPVSELKFAPYNPRKISKKELEKLKKSIETFGYVEPIVWNKRTGHVVGGNQRLKALLELGVPEVEVVEVDLDLEHEKALNVALNKIGGEWDIPLLRELLRELDVDLRELTGFDSTDLKKMLVEVKPIYTTKIPKIQYEPQGPKPAISDLYDAEKYWQYNNMIEKANVSDELKTFLKLAAARWVEFRFDRIAEFYAQSPKEIQELFEKLALVVIDFEDAIQLGIVEFTNKLHEYLKKVGVDDDETEG